MKADEQLKKFNDKYHPDNGFPDTLQKKVNTRNLVSAWETMSAHYFDPIGKTKPLVSKEIGQITQFRKAVGNEDAYRVMKWVISNWSQFLFDITDNTGATLSLKQPHVGTLLKYWNVALAGCNKQSASPKKTGGVKMLSKEEKATT